MTYRTCFGCVHGTGACQVRESVKAQVAGLGVLSLKWKCKWRRASFNPGDTVFVETIGYAPEGDDDVHIGSYPAIVIKVKGPKLIFFIEPGAIDDCEVPFEPMKGGNGHVKVPMSRVTKREGVREFVCSYCDRITRIGGGHEDWCRDATPSQRQAWEEEHFF